MFSVYGCCNGPPVYDTHAGPAKTSRSREPEFIRGGCPPGGGCGGGGGSRRRGRADLDAGLGECDGGGGKWRGVAGRRRRRLATSYLRNNNNNNIRPHTEQYHTVRCTLTKRHGSPKSAQCMAKVDRIKNNRIWRCGRGRRWWVVGGFSRDGEDEWRGWGWQAARGSARNGSAGGRDAHSADKAARSKPGPLLPRWALGVAWLGCGNEEWSGVSRRVDA